MLFSKVNVLQQFRRGPIKQPMTTRIKTGVTMLRNTEKSPPKLSAKSNPVKNKIGISLALICKVSRFMFCIKFISKIQLTSLSVYSHS